MQKELNLKELSLNEESKLRKWFFKHFPGGLFGCKGPWWDNCNTGKKRPGEDPVGVAVGVKVQFISINVLAV